MVYFSEDNLSRYPRYMVACFYLPAGRQVGASKDVLFLQPSLQVIRRCDCIEKLLQDYSVILSLGSSTCKSFRAISAMYFLFEKIAQASLAFAGLLRDPEFGL